MGAQMNIKSEEAYALASEIAEQTGTSLTQVVLEALRERKRVLDKKEKVAEIMAMVRETAARMSPEFLALDHGEYLYGEDGLPR